MFRQPHRSLGLTSTALGTLCLLMAAATFPVLGDQHGPFYSSDHECVVDPGNPNGCQFGANTDCPEPLQKTDFFCSNSNKAKYCDKKTGFLCTSYQNVPCGTKKNCFDSKDEKDSQGNPIQCQGAPDICFTSIMS